MERAKGTNSSKTKKWEQAGDSTTSLLTRRFQRELFDVGLDLCVEFHPAWYNDLLDSQDDSISQRLPVGTLATTAYLIGNTKLLWNPFLTWCHAKQQQDGRLPKDPLDTYSRTMIQSIVNRLFPPTSFQIFWSFDFDPCTLISLQKVAVISGMCAFEPQSQVTIHPIFGPWHSYRAVVVIHSNQDTDVPPPPPPPPPQRLHVSCLLSEQEQGTIANKVQQALAISSDRRKVCHRHDDSTITQDDKDTMTLAWIRVREAVPIGKEYRYCENQLWYHYTEDVRYIKKAIKEELLWKDNTNRHPHGRHNKSLARGKR